jgi:hypothetical protein
VKPGVPPPESRLDWQGAPALANRMPHPVGSGIQLPAGITPPDSVRGVDAAWPVKGEAGDGAKLPQDAELAPLTASPWPANVVAGVIAIDASMAPGSRWSGQESPWWGRAVTLGSATGDGAATAGRATASFFKRIGSSVSQPFTR